MINRTAGEGRYARVEREQRWVLDGRPEGLDRPVSIVDLYIMGTRLRLRRMASDAEVVHKLGQKVRPEPDSPETVKSTNMYLSEREYATVAGLGGVEIHKTRWRWSGGERAIVVDEFQGPHTGLVLAEVELEEDEPRLGRPPGAMTDVTDDDRFSGGTLAGTTATEMAALFVEMGVTPTG